MNSAKNSVLNQPLFWVVIAFLGFALLPSQALDYGLLDSTSDEIYRAMGWSSSNVSWAWFAPLICFALLPLFKFEPAKQAKLELILNAVICVFLFASAIYFKVSMGYATIVLIGS